MHPLFFYFNLILFCAAFLFILFISQSTRINVLRQVWTGVSRAS